VRQADSYNMAVERIKRAQAIARLIKKTNDAAVACHSQWQRLQQNGVHQSQWNPAGTARQLRRHRRNAIALRLLTEKPKTPAAGNADDEDVSPAQKTKEDRPPARLPQLPAAKPKTVQPIPVRKPAQPKPKEVTPRVRLPHLLQARGPDGGTLDLRAQTTKRVFCVMAKELGLSDAEWDPIRGLDVAAMERAAAEKYYQRWVKAATKIQAAWRKVRLKRQVYLTLLRKMAAATRIQRWWHWRMAWWNPLRQRLLIRPQRFCAARRIQCFVRGWKARRRTRAQVELRVLGAEMDRLREGVMTDSIRSAVFIQAFLRGRLARKHAAAERQLCLTSTRTIIQPSKVPEPLSPGRHRRISVAGKIGSGRRQNPASMDDSPRSPRARSTRVSAPASPEHDSLAASSTARRGAVSGDSTNRKRGGNQSRAPHLLHKS